MESSAIGKPIIATRTEVSKGEFGGLKGVFWTGSELKDFMSSLSEVYGNYEKYATLAREQSEHFESYSMAQTAREFGENILRKAT